jgi:cell division septation protein DedD
VSTRALILLAGIVMLPLASPGADPRDEAARRILDGAPAGSPATRAAWIYERARQVPDASVAWRLMEEMPSHAPAEWLARARLWKVRYWMATDSLVRAATELDAMGRVSASDPWFPEVLYWRELTGTAGDLDQDRRPATAWEALAQVASLGNELREPPGVRRALALEGGARRYGILGPWLWQLSQSSESGLRRAARDVVGVAAQALTHAPEAALWIREVTEAREPVASEAGEAPQAPPVAEGAVDTLVLRAGPAVAPASPVVTPAEPARSSPHYVLAVRTLADEETARRLAGELERHGFSARVGSITGEGGAAAFRVSLGPCASPAEAESLAAHLKHELFLPAQVIEVP